MADLVTSMQELVELKVAFVSVADSIDLTTAAGQALAGMLSVFAQFERQLIIERVRSGMNHAKKHGTRSGKAIGRPSPSERPKFAPWRMKALAWLRSPASLISATPACIAS